jgi:hypothetical protein
MSLIPQASQLCAGQRNAPVANVSGGSTDFPCGAPPPGRFSEARGPRVRRVCAVGLGRSAGRLVCRALNLNRKKARVPPAICEIQIDGTVSGPDSHEQRILRG